MLSFAGRSQTGATKLALLGNSWGGRGGSETGAAALGKDWTMLCTDANPFWTASTKRSRVRLFSSSCFLIRSASLGRGGGGSELTGAGAGAG